MILIPPRFVAILRQSVDIERVFCELVELNRRLKRVYRSVAWGHLTITTVSPVVGTQWSKHVIYFLGGHHRNDCRGGSNRRDADQNKGHDQ